MTLIFYKLLAALLIFAIGMVTAIYPLWRKHAMKPTEPAQLGEALASGIFLGAAFFHMLPDAIRTFAELYTNTSYPIPELVCVGGFLLLLFLERLSLTDHGHHHHHQPERYIPYILVLTLVIHALTEGAALGISGALPETTMLFIAILAHKGSECFALSMMLLRFNLSLKKLMWIVTFFAFMTPLGILFGAEISRFAVGSTGALTSALFNAFAAGTFLYISTLHHVHFHAHEHHEKQGLLEFACLVAGTATMALIAMWA